MRYLFVVSSAAWGASMIERAIANAREEARAGYFTGPGWAPTWHEPDTQQVW